MPLIISKPCAHAGKPCAHASKPCAHAASLKSAYRSGLPVVV
jgi:hypothetical protein